MRPVVLLFFLTSLIPSLVNARVWARNNTCLTEIKVTIPNGDRCDSSDGNRVPFVRSQQLYFGTMVSAHDAVTRCANISSLDLRVNFLGCSTWLDPGTFR